MGTATDASSEDIRLYVGILNPSNATHLAHTVRDTGLWCTTLDDLATSVVSHIRTTASLIGFAKRYGLRTYYQLYFGAQIPLTGSMLDYMGRVLPSVDLFSNFVCRFGRYRLIEPSEYLLGRSN